jgi:cytochrome c553
MVHHSRRLAGQAPIPVAAAAADPLAQDGVSCTVCHQIQAEGLGAEATFAGKGRIDKGRRIFGPFTDPAAGPMRMLASYEVQHGAHVHSSALCGSCHTLHTGHTGDQFPEQTPYLEWRNSEFTDEPGATATSRSCQQCHMADLGSTRIARNPGGGDFLIPVREPYRSHSFVGGNAFLLELLADNREALGVKAEVAALRKNAMASRRLLAEQTVAITIGEPVRRDGALHFAVRVDNLSGHKFPTGYPSRRAWLHVQVRAGNRVVFDSGGWTKDGRLAGVADELRQPHHTHVTSPEQVVVWELIAADAQGEPTTHLTRMQHRAKDTRLLPKGWRHDGPHAADTAPVGIGADIDFTAGGDSVDFEVPLAADAPAASVVAWVRYQTIPPHWVDAVRTVDADECRTFVPMYDAADKTPETAGVAMRAEAR